MHKLFPFIFLLSSVLFFACGEDDSATPTVLAITTFVQEAEEEEQFAITVRIDTPNRTGTDLPVTLIYEGIGVGLIAGSGSTPVIQQDQQFNSLLLMVADDPDSTGDRELTIKIDESQVPAGLTLGNSSLTITITDK